MKLSIDRHPLWCTHLRSRSRSHTLLLLGGFLKARGKVFLPGSSSDPFQYTSSRHRKWPLENLLDGNGICWAQPRKLEAYNPRAAGAWVCIRSLGRAGRQEARRRSRQRQAWWRAITFDTRSMVTRTIAHMSPNPRRKIRGSHTPFAPFIKLLATHCTVQYAPLFFFRPAPSTE